MLGQLYIPVQERNPFRSVTGVGAAFFPPGVNLPGAEGLDVFSGLMQQLQQMGIYTPWATRMGSMDWQLISQPPDTNIVIGKLDDSLYKEILGVGLGTPLPFIGVLTEKLPTPQQVTDAFVDTPYAFYETQAVYSQSDPGDPPKIWFLHWLELRAPDDRDAGSSSLVAGAARLQGQLGVLMQVGYTDTHQRQPPSTSFDDALNEQLGVREGTTDLTPVTTGPTPDSTNPDQASQTVGGLTLYQVGIAATVALVCGVGGYFAYQAITRERR